MHYRNGLITVFATATVLASCATPSPDRVVVCKIPNQAAARSGPALVGRGYGVEMSPIPLDSVQFTNAGLWEIENPIWEREPYDKNTPLEVLLDRIRVIACQHGRQRPCLNEVPRHVPSPVPSSLPARPTGTP